VFSQATNPRTFRTSEMQHTQWFSLASLHLNKELFYITLHYKKQSIKQPTAKKQEHVYAVRY